MVYDPDSDEHELPHDHGAQAVSKAPKNQHCDDDPSNDDPDDWDDLDESAEPLDSLDFLDDSEPEPQYGDFWFENDDWEDR